jgi:hypothetical protein
MPGDGSMTVNFARALACHENAAAVEIARLSNLRLRHLTDERLEEER